MAAAAAGMAEARFATAHRPVGWVTTAIVSAGAAAAVGWAAAVPVRAMQPARPQPDDAAATRSAQELVGARASLERVRRDVALLVSREDHLPRAKLATVPDVVASLPNVRVPQSAAVQPVMPAAPPVAHTSTGASGGPP